MPVCEAQNHGSHFVTERELSWQDEDSQEERWEESGILTILFKQLD